MAINNCPLWSQHHNAVEQSRSAELAVDLVNTNDDRDLMFRGSLLKRLQVTAGQINRVRAKLCMKFGRQLRVASRSETPDPHRVARNESFREHKQRRTLANRFIDRRKR